MGEDGGFPSSVLIDALVCTLGKILKGSICRSIQEAKKKSSTNQWTLTALRAKRLHVKKP